MKTSLKKTLTLLESVVCERELETKQRLQYIDPHSYGHQSFFPILQGAQLEAQGPRSLLDAGFLYRILSPTGLVSKTH